MSFFVVSAGWRHRWDDMYLGFRFMCTTLEHAHSYIQDIAKLADKNCNVIEIVQVDPDHEGYRMRELWRIDGDGFYRESVIINSFYNLGQPYPIELPVREDDSVEEQEFSVRSKSTTNTIGFIRAKTIQEAAEKAAMRFNGVIPLADILITTRGPHETIDTAYDQR